MARTKQTTRGAQYHALAGGGHRGHRHHRGGGYRGYPPGWWPQPVEIAYPAPDPCTMPWLFPRGACAVYLENQKDALKGMGACCDGCAAGRGCSGGAMGDFDGTKLTTAVVIGAIGLLAYHAFFK